MLSAVLKFFFSSTKHENVANNGLQYSYIVLVNSNGAITHCEPCNLLKLPAVISVYSYSVYCAHCCLATSNPCIEVDKKHDITARLRESEWAVFSGPFLSNCWSKYSGLSVILLQAMTEILG